MSLSTLTAFDYIAENSLATPGLFNRIFSQLSDNIGTVNQAITNPLILSGSTYASIGLVANSSNSDYIRMVDSSGQRSTYIIGSHAGGSADGLAIYDESGSTMLALFSKQSIRFYQNVVGPVFDVGGALASTLNAATYGTAADSKESRIQAAISAATAQGIARVYVPANMYPYSSGSVSFSSAVQMVREGGNWTNYDIKAYGATGDGAVDDTSALSALANVAIPTGGGTIYLSGPGTYKIASTLTIPANIATEPGQGALLKVSSGQTLNFVGPFGAGVRSVFSTSGGGSVSFGIASTVEVIPEWWGALGDGSTDDSTPIQTALNTGKDVKFRSNATYISATTQLYIKTTGQTVRMNGATISTVTKTQSVFAIGTDSTGTSVPCNYVTIQDGIFVGFDAGDDNNVPFAIDVVPPLTDPYTQSGGCGHITINNCRESGFCFGVRATAANNLSVTNSAFGGNKYHLSLGAGGYGVLLQSCFQSRVVNNAFSATSTDRHAIYVSANGNRAFNDNNLCKGVVIAGNSFDWTALNGVGVTQFEAPLELRAPQYCTVSGNLFRGGYGGIDYTSDNGDGKELTIVGNTFDGQIAGASTRGCIAVSKSISTGTFILDTLNITGNNLNPAGALTYGIILNTVKNVTVTGNVSSITQSVAIMGIGDGVGNLTIQGNTWNNNANYIYECSGSSVTNVTFGVNSEINTGGGLTHLWTSFPASPRFGYVRTAQLDTNSNHTVTITSDPYGIIKSVVTDPNGVKVCFQNNVDTPGKAKCLFLPAGSPVFTCYIGSTSGQTVIIASLDSTGAVRPADTNTYALICQVTS